MQIPQLLGNNSLKVSLINSYFLIAHCSRQLFTMLIFVALCCAHSCKLHLNKQYFDLWRHTVMWTDKGVVFGKITEYSFYTFFTFYTGVWKKWMDCACYIALYFEGQHEVQGSFKVLSIRGFVSRRLSFIISTHKICKMQINPSFFHSFFSLSLHK